MVALLFLAVALGLSNFAGAIGIGVSGVSGRLRVRIAVLFGMFEAGMPVLGLVLGHSVASGLGRTGPWLGGGLLIAIGIVNLVLAVRGSRAGAPSGPRRWGTWRVLVSAVALSLDNLAAGFALGAFQVGLAVAAPVFGVVSVIMSLAGLELGARIGAAAGKHSELIAGAMLVGVGAAMAVGVI